MDSILEKLPKTLSSYLKDLMTDEGYTGEDKRRWFVKNWIKKRALFEKIVEHNGFVLTDKIGLESKKGIFIITYSGSLLTISGEKPDKTRDVVYESIKLRRDNYPKTEETSITIDFPLEINKPVNVNGGKLVKTSPVFSMAIEKGGGTGPVHTAKGFQRIREKISNALKSINNVIFSTTGVTELENREDLFNKWIILTWFRTGGIEEEVFLARAHMLWIELFDKLYRELLTHITDKEKQDESFLHITNEKFTHFCDVYKWLESEKKDFDIGLMKALEEIPERDDYNDFIRVNSKGDF